MSSMAVGQGPAAMMRLPKRSALAHIPGDEGWPLVGRTFELLADPKGYVEDSAAKYGPVYRTNAFGQPMVTLLGPEANEFVLLDQQRRFSSELGWDLILGRLFSRGLMLLDFDEHRVHRKVLSVAFKAGPMRSYLNNLDEGIGAHVRQWRASPGSMLIYPAIKQLTLDLAATSFLGEYLGGEADRIRDAFIDMISATMAIVRRPFPGTKMRRGVEGRARIAAYFDHQIPIRRHSGGDDLFSHLCKARHVGGDLLSRQEIVDHMIFLMMAAHDTMTSSLTSLVWLLIENPSWQEKMRDEVHSLNLPDGEELPFEKLEAMPLTEMAFKETMRINPPVPSIPRRALREFEFGGYQIPAGTPVNINPLYTHHMPEIWPEPARFDPLRFTNEAQLERHRFAWVPFSGGAHMCLGLHFAYMQAKCFTRHLLRNLQLSAEPGYRPTWQMWPIPKPRDGLHIKIRPAG